jgi:hypothetical protein
MEEFQAFKNPHIRKSVLVEAAVLIEKLSVVTDCRGALIVGVPPCWRIDTPI